MVTGEEGRELQARRVRVSYRKEDELQSSYRQGG